MNKLSCPARASQQWYPIGRRGLIYESNGESVHADYTAISLDWLPEHMPLFKGVPRDIAKTLNLPSRYGERVLWEVVGPGMRNRGGLLITSEPQVWKPFLSNWIARDE